MSEPLSWDDLEGHRIGIYGLGREGEASLRACQARGIEPLLVDDTPPAGGLSSTSSGSMPRAWQARSDASPSRPRP